MPAFARIAGLTTTMYDIVVNVVRPATISRMGVVLCSFSLKIDMPGNLTQHRQNAFHRKGREGRKGKAKEYLPLIYTDERRLRAKTNAVVSSLIGLYLRKSAANIPLFS